MKSVLYTRTAATALRRHANRAKLIRTKIRQYADDASSQANNVKPLIGVDAKRLRVGDFRVIFTENKRYHYHSRYWLARATESTNRRGPCP